MAKFFRSLIVSGILLSLITVFIFFIFLIREIIMNTDSETIRHGAFFVLGIGAMVIALGVLSVFYVG